MQDHGFYFTCTEKEIFDTMEWYRDHPEERKRLNAEALADTSSDCVLIVDECGFGHLSSREIHVSSASVPKMKEGE